jgi:hypothetical protein
MVQRSQHVRLALETNAPLSIAGDRGGQHFQRDLAPQLRIPGAIDFAHRSGADALDNDVVTNLAAGRKRHRREEF